PVSMVRRGMHRLHCLAVRRIKLWLLLVHRHSAFFFFSLDPASSEIYSLSLHDALPISFIGVLGMIAAVFGTIVWAIEVEGFWQTDRKSTRLNSSHDQISYAVFCLKKKKNARLALLNLFP